MTARLRVLYLPESHVDSEAVIGPIRAHHDIAVFDARRPPHDQVADVHVVIDSGGSGGNRELYDAAKSVRLWQIVSSGIDHFDLAYWSARGIPVANTPGPASAPALAEAALMFILMLARRFPEANDSLRHSRMGRPPGTELEGRRLGLVGFGESARALTRLVRPLGMLTSAIEIRDVSADEQREFGMISVRRPEGLDELVAESDVLSLHLHLTSKTRHIIDARRVALMKAGAFLVNVARGALVDERALADALEAGRLGGAGLDVFEFEPPSGESLRLVRLPSVVATPHTAANTGGTLRRRGQMCLENLDRVAAGLEPKYRVAGPGYPPGATLRGDPGPSPHP